LTSLKNGLKTCSRFDFKFPLSLRDAAKTVRQNSIPISLRKLIFTINDRSEIQFIKVDRNHVELNESVMLSWSVNNCNNCNITIKGKRLKDNHTVLVENNLSPSGSMVVKSDISTKIRYTIETSNICDPQKSEVEASWVDTTPDHPPNTIPVKGIRIFNGSLKKLHIWMFDATGNNPNPQSEEIVTLDNGAEFSQQFEDEHSYRFVAVDPLKNNCNGNEPNNINCIHEKMPELNKVLLGNSSSEEGFWNII